MFISSFVRQLFATGTVVAVSWDDSIEISEELAETIRAADALARAEAAFEAPQLDLKAAEWSLQVLAWGCNLLMNRTEVNTNLPIRLAEQEPKGESVREHWSADLGFRFFNSLILRCQQIGPYDSLLQQLIQIGHRWPLSLVGVQADVSQAKLELLLSNNCLRSVLVDRVVESKDEQLAQHPLLAPHIAQAVGAHPNFKQWQTSNSGKLETVAKLKQWF
ncbi:MAG: hypothetical protein SFV81_05655 [Pirellulaceae bacterium]|nr:hypothetical protein [Pirellulaceae bacterium]